jgi:D-cysteine desulfhydrase
MISLFERFPGLDQALPHMPLADLPTPVEDAGRVGRCRLWVKRDDLTGRLYGGNKLRKLEFLLGDAVRKGYRRVFTFGVAGSNHALATSVYATALGLESIPLLTPQANAAYTRRNLLVQQHVGARLRHFEREPDAEIAGSLLERVARRPALRIKGGGSSPLGTVGYVNAGLELAGQIHAGECPRPDAIYVALGTMGTAAGLSLGLRAAGLDVPVVMIRVVRDTIANPTAYRRLYAATAVLLRKLDLRFPKLPAPAVGPDIRHDHIGPGYARFTPEGMDAVAWAAGEKGIKLEGTYTGKAMAALREAAASQRNRTLLFWNTYNSRPLPPAALERDWRSLPGDFHGYFTRPLQPLDPESG